MGFVMITLEGRCLRAVTLSTGETALRADEAPGCEDAVFERIDLAHGRVALRIGDGRYLSRHVTHPGDATGDGTGDGTDNGTDNGYGDPASLQLVAELTQCTAFEELEVPGGCVALRACDSRFLGVHASGAVVADRVSAGSWERFCYLEAPAPLVAVQRPSVPSQAALAVEPVVLAPV